MSAQEIIASEALFLTINTTTGLKVVDEIIQSTEKTATPHVKRPHNVRRRIKPNEKLDTGLAALPCLRNDPPLILGNLLDDEAEGVYMDGELDLWGQGTS